MRFLSSSALPKAAQLILAASCSAAEAIVSLRAARGAVFRMVWFARSGQTEWV
jgi:hypothetical protein